MAYLVNSRLALATYEFKTNLNYMSAKSTWTTV